MVLGIEFELLISCVIDVIWFLLVSGS